MQLHLFANLLQAGKYPWLVTVLSTSSPVDLVCAGTLVASKYVVTAAQCVYNKPPHALRFKIGDHDLLVEEAGEQQLRVADVMVHERYDPSTKANDIALVELTHHLDLEARVSARPRARGARVHGRDGGGGGLGEPRHAAARGLPHRGEQHRVLGRHGGRHPSGHALRGRAAEQGSLRGDQIRFYASCDCSDKSHFSPQLDEGGPLILRNILLKR